MIFKEGNLKNMLFLVLDQVRPPESWDIDYVVTVPDKLSLIHFTFM